MHRTGIKLVHLIHITSKKQLSKINNKPNYILKKGGERGRGGGDIVFINIPRLPPRTSSVMTYKLNSDRTNLDGAPSRPSFLTSLKELNQTLILKTTFIKKE